MPKSSKNDDKWIESIRSQIEKLIAQLIDGIDMRAHDAKEYVALMRSYKISKKFISGKVSE